MHDAQLTALLKFSALAFSAIFFVVDPIAVVPVFLAMTASDTEEKKRAMAKRATLTAFCVLTSFSLAGSVIFKLFGVSLGAFKVAGGILLLLTSVEMLSAKEQRTRVTKEEEREGSAKEDVAIFPLAIPLLAGPGAIATVTTLMSRTEHLYFAIPVIASILVTCVVAYFMLRAAGRISQVLGVTGLTVLNRVIGLIIGALAVQFIFDGIGDSFPRLVS